MSRDELLAALPDADALIIRSASKLDAEALAAATKLKMIARAGVGVDNVDLTNATEQGVVVMNTPDGNTVSTAEMTFGLMLALARNIPQAHASLASASGIARRSEASSCAARRSAWSASGASGARSPSARWRSR